MTPSQKQRAIKLLKPLIMEVKRELHEQLNNLYTAKISTADGVLHGYVKYNEHSKKFEVGTDDDFLGRFDEEHDAVEELKNMGFKNIKKTQNEQLERTIKHKLTENTGISKKFTSFDAMPPANVQLFLISKADSTYAVGYFDPATNKLIDVSTPHRKYNSVDISHFRYWAT
jgi:hypothetical protein